MILTTGLLQSVIAQDNSPLSRYGMGDLVPNQNVSSRAMGGVSAAYSDPGVVGAPFSINFINPASLGSLSQTRNFSNIIFDLGGEIQTRTLKSTKTPDKYSSTNVLISYLQIGVPLSSRKMEKKGHSIGMSLGLRPTTRINYKIETNTRITGVDSMNTLYEGSGGLYKANVSLGYKITGKGKHKNEFSIGVGSGFHFGSRNFSTRLTPINDSVAYYKSNAESRSRMSGVFVDAGFQYLLRFNTGAGLRIGGYANLKHTLRAYQSTINETFGYDVSGGVYVIDSVSSQMDIPGDVNMPMTLGGGFCYHSKNRNWMIAADVEKTFWNDFRYYDDPVSAADNWVFRAGAEFFPAKANSVNVKYWNYVKYRAGFYFGPDYIRLNDQRNQYAFTAGASFPLTTPRYAQSRGEYVALNTAFEIGSRGSQTSTSFRENIFRLNIGISMNARWFQKRSYD